MPNFISSIPEECRVVDEDKVDGSSGPWPEYFVVRMRVWRSKLEATVLVYSLLFTAVCCPGRIVEVQEASFFVSKMSLSRMLDCAKRLLATRLRHREMTKVLGWKLICVNLGLQQ